MLASSTADADALRAAPETATPRRPEKRSAPVRALLGTLSFLNLPGRVYRRVMLSRAKHPSLAGHPKMARRIAPLIPFYEYGDDEWFRTDDAPVEVAAQRRAAFEHLSARLTGKKPKTLQLSRELGESISDVEFTSHYRVPFQFRRRVREHLEPGCVLQRSEGANVTDLDGNVACDVTGSYGVNLLGTDFYRDCIERGAQRVRDLGPVLGSYHPIIGDVANKLCAIAGLDAVSFHMSGTEAVMQSVRLARYHTGRSHLVRFCGSYHGWWDGVQTGIGNPRPGQELYTFKEMSEDTLAVLRQRRDIACVLVNPLQALHPNASAPADSTLISNGRQAGFDKAAYTAWLRQLREVCDARGIVLIFDEVFLGFRLAKGGAQEYFGVKADLVTYGKTLGGGLPVGVLAGRRELMRRFRADQPTNFCFARGTFNSHPYVIGAMYEFLAAIDRPEVERTYENLDAVWDGRCEHLNRRLDELGFPLRIENMTSVASVIYTRPGRYHWMLQFYLRDAGIYLPWIGTGRLIFNHAWTDADFDGFAERFVSACEAMHRDGWWWTSPKLTSRWIRRRILRETLRARFGRGRRPGVRPEK